eukprot:COSAG01_NODE_9873_length_2315_cov_1.282942_1_plen_679_part_10
MNACFVPHPEVLALNFAAVDSRDDLFVVNHKQRNELFLSDGSGGLVASPNGGATLYMGTTLKTPEGDINAASQGAVIIDVNQDGAMDIYVLNYGSDNELLVSDGFGGFQPVGPTQPVRPAIYGNPQNSVAAVVLDCNKDGWSDLYVINFKQSNQLFMGDGRRLCPFKDRCPVGGFTAVTTGSVVSGDAASMAAVVLDVDHDTNSDIFVVNYGAPNQLFTGDGMGGFVAITSGPAVSGSTASTAAVVLFANRDAHPDIYITNDYTNNQLFVGDGVGGFAAVTSGPAVSGSTQSRGVVVLDANKDKQMDLYVANQRNPNSLFVNDPCTDGFALSNEYSWQLRGPMNCGHASATMATRAEAEHACGRECAGISDQSCNGTGPWAVCTQAHLYQWKASSTPTALPCVHHKLVSANCYACPRYSSDDRTQVDKCRICPGGTLSVLRATKHDQRYLCIPCAAGRYRPGSLMEEKCSNCPQGRFSSAGASACTDCPRGRVAPDNTTTECTVCAAGRAPSADRTECQACTGSNVSAFGIECAPCPKGSIPTAVGRFALAGCTPCPARQTTSTDGSVCGCQDGYYNASAGVVRCLTPQETVSETTFTSAPNECAKCPTMFTADGNDIRSCVSCVGGIVQVSKGFVPAPQLAYQRVPLNEIFTPGNPPRRPVFECTIASQCAASNSSTW